MIVSDRLVHVTQDELPSYLHEEEPEVLVKCRLKFILTESSIRIDSCCIVTSLIPIIPNVFTLAYERDGA